MRLVAEAGGGGAGSGRRANGGYLQLVVLISSETKMLAAWLLSTLRRRPRGGSRSSAHGSQPGAPRTQALAGELQLATRVLLVPARFWLDPSQRK